MGLDGTGVDDRAPTKRVVAFTSRMAGSCACGCLLPGHFTRTRRLKSVRVRSLSCCPAGAAAYVRCSVSSLFRHNFHAGGNDVHAPRDVRDCTALTAVVFRAGRGRRRNKRTVPTFSFFVTGNITGSFHGRLSSFVGFCITVRGNVRTSRGTVHALVGRCLPSVRSSRQRQRALHVTLVTLRVGVSGRRLTHVVRGTCRRAQGSARRTVRKFVRGLGAVRSHNNGRIMFDSVGCNASASTRNHVIVRRLLGTAVRKLKAHNRMPMFPVRVFGIGSKISCSRGSCRGTVGVRDVRRTVGTACRTPGFSLLLGTYRAASGTLFPGFVFLSAPFGGGRG